MKRKKYVAMMLSLIMALSMVQGVTVMASGEESIALNSIMSYTANVGTNTLGNMDGYAYRPYAISWTLGGNTGQYRVGYIAFAASNLDKSKKITSAKLNLTISRTQGITSASTIIVYATDYNQIAINGTTPGVPAKGVKVGAITMPSNITGTSTTLTTPVTADLDLSSYFSTYPNSTGIGLYLTNRDDVAESNSYGLVGMYGYNESNAPTLTVTLASAASFDLTYKAGDLVLGTKQISDCVLGNTYTLTEEQAPNLITVDDKIYIRNNVNQSVVVNAASADNAYTIEYICVTVESASADSTSIYAGSKLQLPEKAVVCFSDGQTLDCNVTWNAAEISAAESQIGDAQIHGTIAQVLGFNVICNVTVKSFVKNESVVANNGGWNWYVEPSGTHIQPGDKLATRYQTSYTTNGGYIFKHDRTYMGWVEDDGTVVVSQYDHNTGEYTRVVLHDKLESDDHNNPAVIVLPDGRIMAWYSMHTNEPYMYYRVTKRPEDISEWTEEQYYYCRTATVGDYNTYNATYPTAFVVNQGGAAGKDTVYVFWRGVHWQLTNAQFTLPDQNGKCDIVMGQTQLANTTYNATSKRTGSEGTLRPYTKYDYDFENGIIHITFTYTHPDNAAQNPIYYMYLNIADQGLYTAKGTRLQDVPFENRDSYNANGKNQKWGVIIQDMVGTYPELVVFDPKGEARRGWTWDIKANKNGEPCIVYADITDQAPGAGETLPTSFPDTSEDRMHHYYYYARWDKAAQKWVTTFLTYGGKWFHENTTYERSYSGGLTLDHNADDANVVYLAKPTMGQYGNIFEIYRWESTDHGATWPTSLQQPLTQNSKANNARPNVIYNYKQNEDGTHGPRVLWIRGEYRYWTNYLYKTGVMTDFTGLNTQDDPEMKADAFLTEGSNELNRLSTDLAGKELTAKFKLTNISVGDGRALVAIAHYNKDNKLKDIKTSNINVPARSVPQIPVLGAPKGSAEGTYSTMGSPEIVENVKYTPKSVEEGDRIALLAWNMGNAKMKPIMSIPFEITTEGDRYLMEDQISYDGTQVLKLAQGEQWNGWTATSVQEGGYTSSFGTSNYVAVTRVPFGNTALHLYHGTTSTATGNAGGAGPVMVSHPLPEMDQDYVIRFNIRWNNELAWSYPSTAYSGFLLSHGIPVGQADTSGTNPCAFLFRHIGQDGGTNGRRGYYITYSGASYNSGSTKTVIDWVNGTIGNNTDRLMEGALFEVKITVRPSKKQIECSVNDGYRTGYFTQSYNSGVDWDTNKINNISFNTGTSKCGELFVDDFRVFLLGNEPEVPTVPAGSKLDISSVTATQEQTDHPAAHAVDGTNTTYWYAESKNEDQTPELIADLGNAYIITKVGLQPAPIHSGKTLQYDIYLSEDGANWKRIWRGSSSNNASMDYRDGQLKKAHYVKVRAGGNTSDMTFSIAELEVQGFN